MATPAPKRAQPRRSSLLPFYVVLGLLGLAGVFLLYRQMGGGGGSATTTMQEVVLTPEQLQQVPGISKGQPNAPVTIMEFADFQCPGCGTFAQFQEPLLNEWIENGTVRFVYYDFPLTQLHANSVLAARAGRCANELNGFWPFHDLVFARQREWSDASRGDATDRFEGYAEQVGLNREQFSTCLRSDRFQREVSESYQLGVALGVGGTPTLFINNKRLDDPPSRRADWQALIERERAAAVPSAAASTDTAAVPADSAPAGDTTG